MEFLSDAMDSDSWDANTANCYGRSRVIGASLSVAVGAIV